MQLHNMNLFLRFGLICLCLQFDAFQIIPTTVALAIAKHGDKAW
jgi:hypothetical protein